MNPHQSLFRDLCERASDLVQITSASGDLLFVNKAWLDTLGYAEQQVPTLSVFDILAECDRKKWSRVCDRLAAQDDPIRIELRFRTPDKTEVAVQAQLARRKASDGQECVTAVLRELTRADQLQHLFDLSLDLLCVAGTDGYFKIVNPAFIRLLGYSSEELLSCPFFEFVHPDDQESTVEAAGRLTRGLPVVDFENRYKDRRGEYHWLAWRSAPSSDHALIYATARDITEQKKIERLLIRQAEDLARSNEELEQFAYVASHDLRAPLRSIGNVVDWIEEDFGGHLPEEAGDHFSKLRQQIDQMERLTEGLLKFSMAGQYFPPEEVDTAKLIEEIVILLGPPEGFVVRAVTEMPVFSTFKTPLELVFRNLLSNALQHHSDPANASVTLGASLNGNFVTFEVKDDGPGIPSGQRARVFNMFETLQTDQRVRGTGLGLALVKKIVERYGGEVEVHSREGEGATFRFTWPLHPGEDLGDD